MISITLQNISQCPQPVQPVITEFVHKLLENQKENVHAVLIYGSAAGVNYIHGVSNINVAVVFKTLDFSLLKQSLGLVQWARKHKMATPLFLTREYIISSLDVFPVEFSEIKEQHKVIFGEDIFKDLIVPLGDVRLLCEQQVKGKLLHLRQAYLDIGSNPPVLKKLLISALYDLVPIFRQLIILNGQKPVDPKEEMFGQLTMIFSLDLQPFLAVYQDKSKKAPISSNQVEAHLQNFLSQLEKLSRHLDSL